MSSETSKSINFSSSRFGEFSVAEESIITFQGGLVGFPKEEKFVLLEHKRPFSWLHSVDNPDLAFVVVDGAEFGDGYSFPIPYNDPRYELSKQDEFAILVIVTVRAAPGITTANLKAPLVVNLNNKRGIQLVVEDPNLSTRFPLWQENNQQKQDPSSPKPNK